MLRLARTRPGSLLIRRFNAFTLGTLRWGTMRKPLAPDIVAMYQAPYDTPENRVAIHRFVKDIPLKPHDAAYDAVKYIDDHLDALKSIPKLVIWGRNDFIFDDAFLNEWRRRCPEARFEVLENAGHLVLEDNPETCCNLIDDFFSSTDV